VFSRPDSEARLRLPGVLASLLHLRVMFTCSTISWEKLIQREHVAKPIIYTS
jgi:hypothetical protein